MYLPILGVTKISMVNFVSSNNIFEIKTNKLVDKNYTYMTLSHIKINYLNKYKFLSWLCILYY